LAVFLMPLASRAARVLVASAEVQDVKHVLARLLHAVGMHYIPPTKYAGMHRAQWESIPLQQKHALTPALALEASLMRQE